MVLDKLVQFHGTTEHHVKTPVPGGCCMAALCPGEWFCQDPGAPLLDKPWVPAARQL